MAILSDAEMAQLFHSIDLAYYSATNASGKQQAQQAGGYAEDLLAQNMVANAPKTRVGEVLIHGVPIPREAVFPLPKQISNIFGPKMSISSLQKFLTFYGKKS